MRLKDDYAWHTRKNRKGLNITSASCSGGLSFEFGREN
jgi:hypothetical protein